MDENMMKHGAFSWNELMTDDPKASKEFYTALFGWTYQDMDMGAMTYSVVSAGGREIGGIMPMPPQAAGMGPAWGAYVTVDDADATARKVVELGGQVLVPPTDIPGVGRFLVFRDPRGAVLSAIRYQMQG